MSVLRQRRITPLREDLARKRETRRRGRPQETIPEGTERKGKRRSRYQKHMREKTRPIR